jgi:hypothetical protein
VSAEIEDCGNRSSKPSSHEAEYGAALLMILLGIGVVALAVSLAFDDILSLLHRGASGGHHKGLPMLPLPGALGGWLVAYGGLGRRVPEPAGCASSARIRATIGFSSVRSRGGRPSW